MKKIKLITGLIYLNLFYTFINILLGLIFSNHYIYYILGCILGFILSILWLLYIYKILKISLSTTASQKYIILHFIIRYLLLILITYLLLKLNFTITIATLINLFALKLSSYSIQFLKKYIV